MRRWDQVTAAAAILKPAPTKFGRSGYGKRRWRLLPPCVCCALSGGLQRRLLRSRVEHQADAYCTKCNGGGPDEEPGITVERIEYRSSGPGAESHADGRNHGH